MEKENRENQIQCYCSFPAFELLPNDHFYYLSQDTKQVIFDFGSSSQQKFVFTNVHLKNSFKSFIENQLPSSILDDTYKGYSNAIIFISDNNELNTNFHLVQLFRHINKSIFNISHFDTQTTSIKPSLITIGLSSFIISNDTCVDLISKNDLNIKEIKQFKEIQIEELSYTLIKDEFDSNLFIDKIIKNANDLLLKCNKNNKTNFSLICKLIFLFEDINRQNQKYIYLSKVDLINIPINSTDFDLIKNQQNPLTTLLNQLNLFDELAPPFDSFSNLSMIFQEYIGKKAQTQIVLSLQDITKLTKEQSQLIMSSLSNAMKIQNHPIPKKDSLSDFGLYKSLYYKLVSQNINCGYSGDNNQIITQIEDLLRHQSSINQALQRVSFISNETLNSIVKYRDEVLQTNDANCNEITKLVVLLQDALIKSKSLNQSLFTQKEINGNAENNIESVQQVSKQIDEIIDLLKTVLALDFKKAEVNTHNIEKEAYTALLNYYSLKEIDAFKNSNIKSTEEIRQLINHVIDSNRLILTHLLKGKVTDSYEVIAKKEYYNLVELINESKYNGQHTIEEEYNNYDINYNGIQTMKTMTNESEQLNNKNSMIKGKVNIAKIKGSFDCLVIQKNNNIIEYPSINIVNQQENLKPYSVSSNLILLHSNNTISPKANTIKKDKISINQNTNKKYSTSVKSDFSINKITSFSISRQSGNKQNQNKNKVFQRLKIKQQAGIEYIILQKESKELLKMQLEEKVNEIKHLRLFNEYIAKQKELEITSYNSQLINSKQKIQLLEEEIKELHLAKDYFIKEIAKLKKKKKQLKSNSCIMTNNDTHYSGSKNRPVAINQIKMINRVNNSLDSNQVKMYEKRSKSKKGIEQNESCELTGNSREIVESSITPRIIVNKIRKEQKFNDSALKLLEEMKEDNGLILSEISVLQCKNNEIANDLKNLTLGTIAKDSSSKKRAKYVTDVNN